MRLRLESEKAALEQQLALVRENGAGVVTLPGVAFPVEWTRLNAHDNHRLVNVSRGTHVRHVHTRTVCRVASALHCV
jgi:hypothetical protein